MEGQTANAGDARERNLVTFRLGDEGYAVQVNNVESIIKPGTVTPVPGSPHEVCGIMNLRGRVISVIDLRLCFSMPSKETDDDTRVLVVRYDGGTVGVLVDSVSEVFTLTDEKIHPTPMQVTGAGGSAIEGIYQTEDGGLIALVDLATVLDSSALHLSDGDGELLAAP